MKASAGQESGSVTGSALLAIVLWLVMAMLVEHLWRLNLDRAQEERRAELLMVTSATAARLEAELNSILYLTTGLVGYISAYDDLLEPDRVETALEILHRSARHIRNVALAPDNVIRYIYPLAGNRDALGLDY